MSVAKILFYIFLITIPLGTRTSIFNSEFLYLSDVLSVLFLAAFYLKVGGVFWEKPKALMLFLILSAVSIFFADFLGLAVYAFIRLWLLVIASLAIAKLLKTGIVKIEGIFWTLGGLAILQTLIGVSQFIKQSDLGLQRLGEATLGGAIPGVAKIVVDGAKIVRAYGTFPHPNVLAAFLILGLASFYWLWLRRPSDYKIFSGWKNLLSDLWVGGGIFIVWLGLLLSFSRTAWVIAIVATLAIIVYALVTKNYFRQGTRLTILSIAIFAILFISFKGYIIPRAQFSADEPAVSLRSTYNRIGLDLIKNNLFGVGIGNQVAFTRESGLYEKFGLDQPWQFQPIHNIYLLIASEIGVLGLAAFFAFLIKLFAEQGRSATFNVIVIVMLSSLLAFGFTDHFLWTSQQGMLMLWLAIGLTLGVQKGAPVRN